MSSPITHAVRIRQFWYGPKNTIDYRYQCRGTLAQCRQWVKDRENAPYYLSHNEAARPRYSIVRLDSLGPQARRQADWAETVDWHAVMRD